MARDHVGFEQDAVAERLFQCCIQEFGVELPAHDARSVERLLLSHVNDHGVPAAYEVDGVLQPAHRCSAWPCRLCGLAFAWFELSWYRHNVAQADAAERRLRAAQVLPELDPRRLELQRQAQQLVDGLFSRPLLLANPSGRPSLGLARALAQHLRAGGFKHAEIARFMGITIDAASMRIWSPDMRSVVPYHVARVRTAA